MKTLQLITNLQNMPPETQVVLTDGIDVYNISKMDVINDSAVIFLKEITKRGDIIEAEEKLNETEDTIEIYGDLDLTGI